ncbi:hypothetical protein [Chromobacterium violaceum]|uniref:hypothetical protein n=1 Tax=Chromobacterium violaceum TaxID=536 RepID=UPI0009DA3B04|nr:hypothetical protein [Chromobacterium violaceum]OQS23539.1 hypothetical protein B0T41_18045 [Chromobacterium violaceum]
MRANHFTRPTIAAAVALLDTKLTQAKFDQMVFRLGLEASIPFDTSLSVSKKMAMLSREIAKAGERLISTIDGQMTLTEALVREAVAVTSANPSQQEEQERFVRALALDGFVIQWGDEFIRTAPLLRAALPEEVDLPVTDDEVHQLLKQFGFTNSMGHLDQAIEAHTRGDWAAANSQTRTFMESLFDEIAKYVDPTMVAETTSSENRRAMLAASGFLSAHRNEWTPDGKNYINGLFKMLHTEGSHPGLSDEDRSTFRLHLVLITARTFLRRLKNNG